MRHRTQTLAAILAASATVAAGAVAAPPLSRAFDKPKPETAAPATSSAGLSQPMAPPSAAPASSGAQGRTVTPEPVGKSASTVESSYKISPGDQLDVYVWGDERLQRGLSVLPDGTFAFPLAGTVKASGRTPNELEAELSRLLAGQYRGVAPQVTVSVRQPSGMQVSIVGKVHAPQTIAPTRYVSVLDALALVGGPSDFADVNNIVVLRRIDGKTTVLKTHLAKALKGKPSAEDLSEANNPTLMAGDTVVVP